jgi:hypothetical protein
MNEIDGLKDRSLTKSFKEALDNLSKNFSGMLK